MNNIKLGFAISAVLLSTSVFALRETPKIQLGQVVAIPGGKSTVQISLQPIQDFAQSRWDITCYIPNPASTQVVMQFGMKSTAFTTNWPMFKLNNQMLQMMGNPQGALKPGDNMYVLQQVDNKTFTALNFVNFDTIQNVTISCVAKPSIDEF